MTNCIREYRLAREMTQIALAKALGVSEWTIIRWEKGYTTIPWAALEKLSGQLQVPADILFPALACIPTIEGD